MGINNKSRRIFTALIAGVIALSACSPVTSNATQADSTDSSDSSDSPSGPAYGHAIGTGEKIVGGDGTIYESITIDPESEIYEFNDGKGLPEDLSTAGFTEQDGIESQLMALRYVAEDFIDSKALETGDVGYQEWYENRAPQLFRADGLAEEGMRSPGVSSAVLGNFGGQTYIPKLIHDGAPRVQTLILNLLYVMPQEISQDGTMGIKYSFEFVTNYRVDDANAAALAGTLTGMSGEEFVGSPNAQDVLKDGTGENAYTAYGNVDLTLSKNSDDVWEIAGLQNNTQFSTTAFTQ